jgi:hypothetical protein
MDKVLDRMTNSEHGTWHEDGETRIFTPKPSFFETVSEGDLVKVFNEHPDKNYKLNLP